MSSFARRRLVAVVLAAVTLTGAVVSTGAPAMAAPGGDDAVIAFVDSAFFLMAIPNVIAVYLFFPELKAMTRDYWNRVVKG